METNSIMGGFLRDYINYIKSAATIILIIIMFSTLVLYKLPREL